jgi:hypothetical protein
MTGQSNVRCALIDLTSTDRQEYYKSGPPARDALPDWFVGILPGGLRRIPAGQSDLRKRAGAADPASYLHDQLAAH